ncbi:MAG: VOC family protein [Deltaproteobacteria bacterium]|nr:VOC family protein [Deltaproteobacteria bacterium]
MSNQAGRFVWRELLTADPAAALRYYGEVLGWKYKTVDFQGMAYHLVSAGEREVCGIMGLPPGVPVSHWAVYVGVDDVDAAARRVTSAGGKVMMGPQDIPNIGRFAVALDPQGAAFTVFKDQVDRKLPEKAEVGQFCWEQLNTTDPAAAKAFYSAVVGWQSRPFGSTGAMDVFEWEGAPVGSVFTAPPGAPPHWATYVVVDRLADANARVTRNGGKVLMERIDVPTVGSFSVTQDPTGAVLSLFESAPPAA